MRSGPDLPLRWLVAAGFGSALLATLLVLGAALHGLVWRYLWWSTQSRMLLQARTALGVELEGSDRPAGRRRLAELGASDPERLVRLLAEAGISARIVDRQGRALAEEGPTMRWVPEPSEEQLRAARSGPRGGGFPSTAYVSEAGRRRALVVLAPLGPERALQAASPWGPAEELMSELRRLLGWMGLLALALGGAASFLLARWITLPLERVAGTARRVAGGDLGARTGLSPGRSEIRAVASAFDEMVERLQHTILAQKRFLADASHELKTPLTTLAGMTELLPDATPEERARALPVMEREVERMSRLVDDLLTLSRAEGERPEPRREILDLGEVVRETVEAARLRERDRDLACAVSGPGPVRGDAEALARAIRNVLDNALQYSPPGTPVEVRAEPREGGVEVSVRDRGPGIPEADLPRVFERFYRADRSRARRTGGSGLGLAIVRAIAEEHGGRALLRNREGGGAEVILWFPGAR